LLYQPDTIRRECICRRPHDDGRYVDRQKGERTEEVKEP
jgi:hypothetical protein